MEASQLPGLRRGFESALEFGGGVVVGFFWGRRGPVSFRGCEGEGGPSFGVGSVRRLFLF